MEFLIGLSIGLTVAVIAANMMSKAWKEAYNIEKARLEQYKQRSRGHIRKAMASIAGHQGVDIQFKIGENEGAIGLFINKIGRRRDASTGKYIKVKGKAYEV